MRLLSIIPLALSVIFTIETKAPTTAVYRNGMTGSGGIYAEETIQYMEAWTHSRFMHGNNPDIYISFKFGELPEDVLGMAMPYPGGCYVTISPLLDPENPNRSKYYNFHLVFMHELGHCFGLMHVKDDNAVMYYASGGNQGSLESITEFFRSLNKIRGVKD
jgi:hypothetical protein